MLEDIPYMTDSFIKALYRSIKPSLSFQAKNREEFETWKKALISKVRELLGELPEKAPLTPELYSREEKERYIREKWVIQTEKNCYMPLYLLIPKISRGKLPAILCCHGHGAYGKDAVAGVHFNNPQRITQMRELNYNYGEQMAERGYITIIPDWRSFGERVGYGVNSFPGRDTCNVHFIQHLILGRTLLGANIFDGMRAIDFLLTREEVDPGRIGCMGLSFGGTMTTYLTLLDERIKCGDIICYATTTEHYAINRINFCGSQLVPYLYKYADIGDIMAAIAPKPLLIESGANDTCFYLPSARKAHTTVKKAYEIAGAEEKLWIEVFAGEHSFAGNLAFSFFDKFLK